MYFDQQPRVVAPPPCIHAITCVSWVHYEPDDQTTAGDPSGRGMHWGVKVTHM